jgi:hypothetical protein
MARAPVVKPEQAFVATQILEAIYESAENCKGIEFPAERATSGQE